MSGAVVLHIVDPNSIPCIPYGLLSLPGITPEHYYVCPTKYFGEVYRSFYLHFPPDYGLERILFFGTNISFFTFSVSHLLSFRYANIILKLGYLFLILRFRDLFNQGHGSMIIVYTIDLSLTMGTGKIK